MGTTHSRRSLLLLVLSLVATVCINARKYGGKRRRLPNNVFADPAKTAAYHYWYSQQKRMSTNRVAKGYINLDSQLPHYHHIPNIYAKHQPLWNTEVGKGTGAKGKGGKGYNYNDASEYWWWKNDAAKGKGKGVVFRSRMPTFAPTSEMLPTVSPTQISTPQPSIEPVTSEPSPGDSIFSEAPSFPGSITFVPSVSESETSEPPTATPTVQPTTEPASPMPSQVEESTEPSFAPNNAVSESVPPSMEETESPVQDSSPAPSIGSSLQPSVGDTQPPVVTSTRPSDLSSTPPATSTQPSNGGTVPPVESTSAPVSVGSPQPTESTVTPGTALPTAGGTPASSPSNTGEPGAGSPEPTASGSSLSGPPTSSESSTPTNPTTQQPTDETGAATMPVASGVAPVLPTTQQPVSPQVPIQPQNNEDANVAVREDDPGMGVQSTPFAVDYVLAEVGGNRPTQDDIRAIQSITYSYLSEYLQTNLFDSPHIDFFGESVTAVRTLVTDAGVRIEYEFVGIVSTESTFVPSTELIDRQVVYAFSEPAVETILTSLHKLPASNPFSTTSTLYFVKSQVPPVEAKEPVPPDDVSDIDSTGIPVTTLGLVSLGIFLGVLGLGIIVMRRRRRTSKGIVANVSTKTLDSDSVKETTITRGGRKTSNVGQLLKHVDKISNERALVSANARPSPSSAYSIPMSTNSAIVESEQKEQRHGGETTSLLHSHTNKNPFVETENATNTLRSSESDLMSSIGLSTAPNPNETRGDAKNISPWVQQTRTQERGSYSEVKYVDDLD